MKKIMEKLNKHFFPLLVVAVLLVGSCVPIRASAAWVKPLEYTSLDYTVKYGTDFNIVRFKIPTNNCSFQVFDYLPGNTIISVPYQNYVDIDFHNRCEINVYPVSTWGLSLDNIPVGSKLVVDVTVDKTGVYDPGYDGWSVWKCDRYLDTTNGGCKWVRNGAIDITDEYRATKEENISTYKLDYIIQDIEGATAFVPRICLENFLADRVEVVSSYVEMEVSTEFWSQFQAEQNGKLLNDMVNGTDEQHAIVNDSVQGMQQAGSKLDGLGDQLNSVEKPNVDNMDVSADKLLGGMAATTMLTAPVREIWKNPVALSILTVVVTIVLISWVFFGKK